MPLVTAIDILATHTRGGGVVVAAAWIAAAAIFLRDSSSGQLEASTID